MSYLTKSILFIKIFHNLKCSIQIVDSIKLYFRTKVECAGQCLATDECEAFEFIDTQDNTNCR